MISNEQVAIVHKMRRERDGEELRQLSIVQEHAKGSMGLLEEHGDDGITGEKILCRDDGNYKIRPGAPISRVREMLKSVDERLKDTSLITEYACMTLYCLWYEATRYLEEKGRSMDEFAATV